MKKVAVIMPQPSCNMICEFCVTEDQMGAMSLEQGMALLDQMKLSQVEIVVLGGGEPFLWKPGILNLARYAKNLGFTVQVGTNGILIPEGFETFNEVDRWVIPIESHRAETHNRMRRYKKQHHQIIMKILEKLKAAQKAVTLSTVLTEWNKADILDLARYLNKYNSETHHIHAWHIYQFVPEGRGGASPGAQELPLSIEEYNHYFSEIKKLNLSFKVLKRPSMYNSKDVQFYYFENERLLTKSDK
jgi:MoaA/NifB/PqqE/SkfB family radical SAM enzyme